MLLTEFEVQQAIAQTKAAFPHFTDWEYRNEINGEYFGFSLWGQFILNPEDQIPPRFFITLDTYAEHWYGHLTIGQHCYLWSSADVGDAHLVDTESYNTLEEAIAALKMKTAKLCQALSIS
ncbi:MAG: hypothetical protein AB7N91_10660 [Candidatus Tectimicrobiota bacterium]